jgi:hypothetical protein
VSSYGQPKTKEPPMLIIQILVRADLDSCIFQARTLAPMSRALLEAVFHPNTVHAVCNSRLSHKEFVKEPHS